MRLRNLLFILFSAMAVFPIVTLAIWFYARAVDREIESVRDIHLQIAKNLGTALDRYARDARTGFDVITEMMISGQNLGAAERLMVDLGFQHVCIADPQSGEVLQCATQADGQCPARIPAERLSQFQDLAAPDRTQFSGVLAGLSGEPAIYLVRQTAAGMAIGELATDYLVEQGESITFGKRGHAAIIDHTGNMIAHPLREWRATMKNIAKLVPAQKMMAGETGTVTFFSPALDADMVAGFTQVQSTGWGVMVPQPLAEVRAHAREAQQMAMFIALGALIVAGFISWFLAGVLSRPIRDLIDASKQMSSGNLAARAQITGKISTAEAKELAMAFNGMVAEIARTTEELSKAAEEAKRNEEKAENASVAKSQFLAAMSDEFRTPLNAILSFGQLLQLDRDQLNSEQADAVDLIVKSGEHLMVLVNAVLDLARIEDGQIDLKLEQIRPKDILTDCFEMFEPMARQRNITLSCQELDGCPIMVDAARFKQVVINIISNAIKYNRNGGTVTVSCADQPDGRVRISVADTGRGIEKNLQSKLFVPFARLSTESANIDGTGIGLTIVDHLVAAMNGDIKFESQVDVGTTFTLDFPAADMTPELTG